MELEDWLARGKKLLSREVTAGESVVAENYAVASKAFTVLSFCPSRGGNASPGKSRTLSFGHPCGATTPQLCSCPVTSQHNFYIETNHTETTFSHCHKIFSKQSLQQKPASGIEADNSHEEKPWKCNGNTSLLWISTRKCRPAPSFEITELQSAGVLLVETSESDTQRRKHEDGATQSEKQNYLESFVFEISLEGRKEENWGRKENSSGP